MNCSIAESMQRYQEVLEQAKHQGIAVRGYISCVWGCPYEGEIKLAQVYQLAQDLYHMGCYEIVLSDTIGIATPYNVKTRIEKVAERLPIQQIAVHLHDTYGQAIANIYAALQEGVSVIDSSVAGLGGCPYARGATGNVASEDVVYLLQGLHIQTGIDLVKLCQVGLFISNYLKRETQSSVAKAMIAKNFVRGHCH
jgi:hydroxymethylglutaryl-CoA lyase